MPSSSLNGSRRTQTLAENISTNFPFNSIRGTKGEEPFERNIAKEQSGNPWGGIGEEVWNGIREFGVYRVILNPR